MRTPEDYRWARRMVRRLQMIQIGGICLMWIITAYYLIMKWL